MAKQVYSLDIECYLRYRIESLRLVAENKKNDNSVNMKEIDVQDIQN